MSKLLHQQCFAESSAEYENANNVKG